MKRITSKKLDRNRYPAGLDARTTKAIADYYDARKDQDIMGQNYTEYDPESVWMQVPNHLVPEIQKLIEKRQKVARSS